MSAAPPLTQKQWLEFQGFTQEQWQEYQQLRSRFAAPPPPAPPTRNGDPHREIADALEESNRNIDVRLKANAVSIDRLLHPLRLDLGCGKNKREGFTGVDVRQFPGVDVVADLAKPWPWPDGSVEEVHCSHMLEHVPRLQRPPFFNELHRVLRPGGKATFITPHWASCRAYGDVTHEWPPVSEFFWLYLDRAWREVNAPHNDMYTCDFATTYGYSPAAWLTGRNTEYVQEALTKFKEAAQDMQSTCVRR